MAVTVQTYTATATWTASDLAGAFRSAFIDAGLMTEWFDSFLSGSVENRVLEVQYDNSKTYGKAYYWFQFTTTGVFMHLATGWTAGSDVPSGTQYLDYFATTTNSTANHETIMAMVNTTTATVTRYSSGETSGFAMFLIKNGSTTNVLHIARAAVPRPSWIDLDKSMYHLALNPSANVNNLTGRAGFPMRGACLRRSFLGGSALRSGTNSGQYIAALNGSNIGYWYTCFGNASNTGNNYTGLVSTAILPVYFNNTNTSYSTDSIPVFSGLPYSAYANEALPSDFGIGFHFANNTMAPLDTFTVSAGSEVWDVLAVANSGTITTGASAMILARTT
jgi:hypothetical protein